MRRRAETGRHDPRQEGASPERTTMIRDPDAIQATANARPARAPVQPAAPAAAPAQDAGQAKPSVPLVNPRMRIEPSLNLVVLEFRDAEGTLARSIPSPQEIDAYRSGLKDDAAPRTGIDVEG
jgi:hypothetical protein